MGLEQRRLGEIAGPLVLHDERGPHDLRTTTWVGPSGESAEDVSVVDHDARAVLLVEKQSVFAYLLEFQFASKNRCVLMTGVGYPSRAFRLLSRRLYDQLRLPFYVLADNDPAGYELFFLIARGCARTAGAPRPKLAVPAAGFLGLRVRDYHSLGMDRWLGIALSDAEKRQLQRLRSCDWLESEAAWGAEMDALDRRGFKVEAEALCGISHRCLADEYLPRRLAEDEPLRFSGIAGRGA